MRIAITNCVVQNGGDAAIAFALRHQLAERIPEATIECHDERPEVAAKYYPDLTWKDGVGDLVAKPPIPRVTHLAVRAREVPYLAYLKGFRPGVIPSLGLTRVQRARLDDFAGLDAIVSTGGTYLVERYNIEPRLFEYRLAAALGIPVFFFTQSLGPFDDARNRRILRDVFSRSPMVLLRDERSAQNLRDIGVASTDLSIAADAVFAEGAEQISYDRLPTDRPLRVGVSVRAFPPTADLQHPNVQRFARELADGITRLVSDHSCEVTFISTCQGVAEYWCDDSQLARHIADRLDPRIGRNVQVDDGFHSPEALRSALGDLDLVISTRMHGAIQALVVNTPVIPISYEFKTDELFARLGMSDYVLDISSITAGRLVDVVDRFLREFESRRDALAAAVRSERKTALDAAAALSESIRRAVGDREAPLRRQRQRLG